MRPRKVNRDQAILRFGSLIRGVSIRAGSAAHGNGQGPGTKPAGADGCRSDTGKFCAGQIGKPRQ